MITCLSCSCCRVSHASVLNTKASQNALGATLYQPIVWLNFSQFAVLVGLSFTSSIETDGKTPAV